MFYRFWIGISCFTALSFPITALSQSSLPTVEFSQVSYFVNENVKDSKVLTLTRSNGDLSKPSTVKLIIGADTTATDKDDYDSSKIVLTIEFKPGESIKTISVPIVNDNIVEEKESINFVISEVQGAQLGSKNTASIEITDVDTSKLPNAIRFALVNGVIEYVNNKQQAVIDLEWDLLPLEGSTQLKKEIENNYPDSNPITCSIQNKDLIEKKWIENLTGDLKCRDYLKDAFRIKDLSNLRGKEFSAFWKTPPQNIDDDSSGYNLAKNNGLSTAQYFGLLRDHSQLKTLLSSNGINVFLDVDGDPKPQGEFPMVFSDNIKWEIKIYRFSSNKINFYRFTTKAIVDRFKLVIPVVDPDSGKALPKAKISVKFRKSLATSGIIQPTITANPLEFQTIAKPKPLASEATNAETELITTLGYFFNLSNAEFGKLISNNLLGDLQNISIVTGGLVSDKAVDSLVGINTKFADLGDVKLGGLIGIGINNNNPLFVGPSLSYGGLTFAAGARVSSKNDTVNFDPSGLISLDLSQALGGQQPNKRNIKVNNNIAGGNWGIASDAISAKLALVDLSVDKDPVTVLEKDTKIDQVYLVNIKDCNEQILSPDQQAKILVKKSDSQLGFIPKGIYQFQDKTGKPIPLLNNKPKACQSTGVTEFKL